MKHPENPQRTPHTEPDSTPAFSLSTAVLGSLTAVVPGVILILWGNAAVGVPVAVTLGVVMFLIAGFDGGWKSFGATLIAMLGGPALVTVGKVFGHKTVTRLLGPESSQERDDDPISRLAERAEMSAARAEQLVATLDPECEPTEEQHKAFAELQAELLLIQLEEHEIRRYRLKRSLACVAGLVVASAGTSFLWFDYTRVEAGQAAWFLPPAWAQSQLTSLLGFGFGVFFVWGTCCTLLLAAQQYRRVFAITAAAAAAIAYPVGWSLHSNKPDIDMTAFFIVASSMIIAVGFLSEPRRSQLLEDLNSAKDEAFDPMHEE